MVDKAWSCDSKGSEGRTHVLSGIVARSVAAGRTNGTLQPVTTLNVAFPC